MNRKEYKHCRQMVRENGWFALRWMNHSHRAVFERLKVQRDDELVDRARVKDSAMSDYAKTRLLKRMMRDKWRLK